MNQQDLIHRLAGRPSQAGQPVDQPVDHRSTGRPAGGLASLKDLRDPPSSGWRTQMDLLEGQDWGDLGDYDMGVNQGE